PAPAPAPGAPAPAGGAVALPAEGAALPAGPVKVAAGAADLLVVVDGLDPVVAAAGSPEQALPTLAPGQHLLRAVPLGAGPLSTAAGELIVRVFSVGQPTPALSGFDRHAALLTVGTPYGTVPRDAAGKIGLQLRVDNCPLGPTGSKVRWSLDGAQAETLATYPLAAPVTLGPVNPGQHTLKVWLENGDGTTPANGGLTSVERRFTVQ
ncbi:MAG: hypothetical protein HYU66_02345, partial [Armatimonadetes bacterium]|nr:hypothetical protein [Armatimonadota bacterium]